MLCFILLFNFLLLVFWRGIVDIAKVLIVWFQFKKQVPWIQVWSAAGYVRQRGYFWGHRRLVSRAVDLRVANRDHRRILLQRLLLLTTALLFTLTWPVWARSGTCSVCIGKLRLSFCDYVERLLLLEKTCVTFLILCALALHVETLGLLTDDPKFPLVLLRLDMAWSELVKIFIEGWRVVDETFTRISRTLNRLLLAQTGLLMLVSTPV